MAKFSEIKKVTRNPNYSVDISWDYFVDYYYANAILDDNLDINPPFQRHHVWTEEQKIRYIEHILRGGASGKDIYCNCAGWSMGEVGRDYPNGQYVLVDGKQRIDAVLGFFNNEFPIFEGSYYKDYTDNIRSYAGFKWHVNDLNSYEEVLQWYIDLNAGGTIHPKEEIERVKQLLQNKYQYEIPNQETLNVQSNLARQVLQESIMRYKTEKETIAKKRLEQELNPKPIQKPKRRKNG